MGRVRAYIKPIQSDGSYPSTWTEITDDVDLNDLSDIAELSDNTQFDVGIIRTSSFNIVVKNTDGKYNGIGENEDLFVINSYEMYTGAVDLYSDGPAVPTGSIFSNKRQGSLVKLTWDRNMYRPLTGIAKADGNWFCEGETTIYVGFLQDTSSKKNVQTNKISFKVVGLESIFKGIRYEDWAWIVDDDSAKLVSTFLYSALNVSAVTNIFNVSTSNIDCEFFFELYGDKSASPSNTQTTEITVISTRTLFFNLDYFEILQKILACGFYMYFDKDTLDLHIKPKKQTLIEGPYRAYGETALSYDNHAIVTAMVEAYPTVFTFYGPSSYNGPVNIVDISDVSYGMDQVATRLTMTFNGATRSTREIAVAKSTLYSPSYEEYFQYISKDLGDFSFIATQADTISTYADYATVLLKNYYYRSYPKKSFYITSKLDYETLAINLYDKVKVDHPFTNLNATGDAINDFYSGSTVAYYVIEKRINLKDETIKFKVRKA